MTARRSRPARSKVPARQVLTLRIVNAGVYEMRVEGDGDDITGSVTVL